MVAMSGGVDSSVTAALLKQKGFEVSGVFMLLAQQDGEEQAAKVKGIADFLEIPFSTLDLTVDFKALVLDYFTNSYLQGRTPNPCVVCNRRIKFGKLLEYALALGMDYLATGHYARTAIGEDGVTRLLRGKDPRKDQSYFLCALRQQQLARILFPLAGISKPQVYKLAAELGLAGRHGSESQDICFMAGHSLKDYFAAHLASTKEGDFITATGEVKGRHQGIHHYTVGQRRGLGLPDATPFYVTGLDAGNNRVIIGKEQDLWHSRLRVKEINWLAGQAPALPAEFLVKIRYRHSGAPAIISREEHDLLIEFKEPQRAITPGQFAALYFGDEVVGGGEIC